MFYDDGLNFSCRRCMYCCSAEPGYVFLSEDDITRLSAFFSLDRDTFIKQYCRMVDYGTHFLVSLRERKNYDCEFLTPQGCSVYEARPLQCRTYPFWGNILESREKWDEEASYCPGINKGERVRGKEIEKILRKSEENPCAVIFKTKKVK